MSYCQISRKHFIHNINQFAKFIPIHKIGLILKDNAYGHGLTEIAGIAKGIGIKHAIVKDLDEAYEIKELFETVLVLYDIPKETVQSNISIAINSLHDIQKVPSKTSVELKVDTGMHRNGILPEELHSAIALMREKNLILKGVFSHFASANENNNSMFNQKTVFDNIISDVLSYRWDPPPRFHCSNTSGTIRFDNTQYDLVRIGLGAYGYIDIFDEFEAPILKPVLSLWANKISSRIVYKGESIGYGGAYTAGEKMIVSTYDIGYGDGFFRADENKSILLENGNPILGRISMDCFSASGDENTVCLFSDAKELAYQNNTIIYEILVMINQKIKRIIVD